MGTIIEILVDLSNSMGSYNDGKYLLEDKSTRMSAQKKILINEILPTIDYASTVTIRTFYSKKINEIETLIANIKYHGPGHLRSMQKVISQLPDDPQKTGGTPITDAITLSIKELSKKNSFDKKIILVTDGGETGKGNYIAKSKEAIEQYNIQCKIFIIGIAQSKEQEEKSRELAIYTQGVFINITSSAYDPNRIKAQLAPIKTAIVQDTIEIKSQNQKIEITSEQINDNLLEQKLIQIKQESDKSGFANNVEELIQKIKSQLEISQGLLNEVQKLKRQIESFDFYNIRSTTLSIDPDYSEEIRQKSELYAFDILKNRHPNKIIVWLNEDGESYANHDFEIQDDAGNIENVIECKGTPLDRKTFYLTDSEWDYFRGLKEIYQVIRVFNLNQNTDHLIIENLYDSLMTGKVVPYLLEPEILKERRVYLTIN